MERRGQFTDPDDRRHSDDRVFDRLVQIPMLQANPRLAHPVVIAAPVHVYQSLY